VQPSPALDPTRPHINVAILGHAGHGKTRLASALTARSFVHESRPWAKHTRRIQYVDLPTYMVRTEAVRHAIAHVVEHESPFRHYDSLEAPGQRRFIRAAMMTCGVADVVLLVVSAVDGALSQTREHALIARALGVEQIVVFLSHCDLVSDPDQLDLAENDVREVLTEVGYDGDGTAFVRGALGVEHERWDATIDDLIATLDRSVADPARDSDSPAQATVLWRYDGARFGVRVALVHVRQGVIRKGDRLLAMFRGQRQRVSVEELRVFDRPVEAAGPGDIVSISLGGIANRDAHRALVRRGTVMTARIAARLTRANSRPNSSGCGRSFALFAVARGGASDRRGVGPQTLGVLPRIALHVGDDAIARVRRCRRRTCGPSSRCRSCPRARRGRSAVELHRIEDLLGRDVAGGACHEATCGLGRHLDGAHHAEVDHHGRERLGARGVAVLLGSKRSRPPSGSLSQRFAGLMSRCTRPAPCSAARPAHDSGTTCGARRATSAARRCTASGPRRSGARARGRARRPRHARSMMLATLG
jgi:elongation factor Tu